jgi:hypothetical protein
MRRLLAVVLIVVGAGTGAFGGGESALLAGASIVLYLFGFAFLSDRPMGASTPAEMLVDRVVVYLACSVLALSLVATSWARNAGNATMARASVLGINAGGLAVIALLGVHVMRAVLRYRRANPH